MAEDEKSIGQSIKDTVSKGLSDFKSYQEDNLAKAKEQGFL